MSRREVVVTILAALIGAVATILAPILEDWVKRDKKLATPPPQAKLETPPPSSQRYPGADSYDGVDCNWGNSLAGKSNDKNYKTIWTGDQPGGDGGFRIPDRYQGKLVEVEFAYDVLEVRVQAGIDQYTVGMVDAA